MGNPCLFLLNLLLTLHENDTSGDYQRCNGYSSDFISYVILPRKGTRCERNAEFSLPLHKLYGLSASSLSKVMEYFPKDLRISIHGTNADKRSSNAPCKKLVKQRCFLLLLLLMSGNVKPNPGPDNTASFTTPAEFKERLSGIGFLHINVRSLASKMDTLRIWARSTNADVIVISETWLSRSVSDKDIGINGYRVFRTDRPKRGGGVAIYIKTKFQVEVLFSKSVPKQFELLALKLEISEALYLTIIGC